MPVTVIPPGTSIDGHLETRGDLTIEGCYRGEIAIGGRLTIAAGASCRAEARARDAEVYGELIGNLTCTQLILVASSGRVAGDLHAPDVSVEAGAEVDGKIDLAPPAPATAPVRRTTAQPRGPRPRRPTPPPRVKA